MAIAPLPSCDRGPCMVRPARAPVWCDAMSALSDAPHLDVADRATWRTWLEANRAPACRGELGRVATRHPEAGADVDRPGAPPGDSRAADREDRGSRIPERAPVLSWSRRTRSDADDHLALGTALMDGAQRLADLAE